MCRALPSLRRRTSAPESEIISELDLGEAEQFVASFDRPNIRYTITEGGGGRENISGVSSKTNTPQTPASSIACRAKKPKKPPAGCRGKGRTALPYHAGLPIEQRANQSKTFFARR